MGYTEADVQMDIFPPQSLASTTATTVRGAHNRWRSNLLQVQTRGVQFWSSSRDSAVLVFLFSRDWVEIIIIKKTVLHFISRRRPWLVIKVVRWQHERRTHWELNDSKQHYSTETIIFYSCTHKLQGLLKWNIKSEDCVADKIQTKRFFWRNNKDKTTRLPSKPFTIAITTITKGLNYFFRVVINEQNVFVRCSRIHYPIKGKYA